jgi:hypothetical protein
LIPELMQNDIAGILKEFEPITLEEMDAVRLMNRMDIKFLFNAGRLPMILEALKDEYRVLEVGGCRCTHYETLYFDSENHGLYLRHHNGKLNRVKVRCRSYVDSDTSFFEIKTKNNKGRTMKVRVKRKGICSEIAGKEEKLLEKTTGLSAGSLKPALWVYFSRITFVNKGMTERMTIDTGLHFKNGESHVPVAGLVIAELKQEKSGRSSFQSLMNRLRIPAFSISKYCLGIISLNPKIKQNNFKSKLIQIKKITHGFN